MKNTIKQTSKTDWNDEKIKNRFIEMYTKVDLGIYVYTFNDIMEEFDIGDRSTIRNAAIRYGLEKREISLYNSKNKLNYEERKFIMENHNKFTEKEFSDKFNKSERIIIEFMKSQNLTIIRDHPRSKKEIYMENNNFVKDYKNLLLSTTYIARKYGLKYDTIKTWRNEDFGYNYKQKIDKGLYKTAPESIFEDLLYELEIPFFYEWKIDKWTIDYYLGKKLCIEIDGTYWHKNTEYVKNKDNRKKEDLTKKGYTLLNFTENEIYNNIDYVKRTLQQYIK